MLTHPFNSQHPSVKNLLKWLLSGQIGPRVKKEIWNNNKRITKTVTIIMVIIIIIIIIIILVIVMIILLIEMEIIIK